MQAVLAERAPGDARPEAVIEHAVRQTISRAVAPEGVIDIFAAAGLCVLVKRILRKYGYPPDKREKATPTVL